MAAPRDGHSLATSAVCDVSATDCRTPVRYARGMRFEDDVREVFRLAAAGMTPGQISMVTGVSASQVRRWLGAGDVAVLGARGRANDCEASGVCVTTRDVPRTAYAYLSVSTLGDGHIVHNHRGVYRLRCVAAPRTPTSSRSARRDRTSPPHVQGGPASGGGSAQIGLLLDASALSVPATWSGSETSAADRAAAVAGQIVLSEHPGEFVRGLLHSDGWRGTNRFVAQRVGTPIPATSSATAPTTSGGSSWRRASVSASRRDA